VTEKGHEVTCNYEVASFDDVGGDYPISVKSAVSLSYFRLLSLKCLFSQEMKFEQNMLLPVLVSMLTASRKSLEAKKSRKSSRSVETIFSWLPIKQSGSTVSIFRDRG
jgi:hypothetical protein